MLAFHTSFKQVWGRLRSNSLNSRFILDFISFLEKKYNANFVFNDDSIPYGRLDLIDLFELATKLREAGILNDIYAQHDSPDEPPFFKWLVECNTDKIKEFAGGMSIDNDRNALTAAIAEAVERYLWWSTTDYFEKPVVGTSEYVLKRVPAIAPEEFVSYSESQRQKMPCLKLDKDTSYLWIRGYSHTQSRPVWLPAQVVSAAHTLKPTTKEPHILSSITNGLATGPTKEFALLNGAMELVERDAFMTTWLNQLTPQKIDLGSLAKSDSRIKKLVTLCERYRLSLSVVMLPTDAPAYAVCAVVQDFSNVGAEVTVGLKAHRELTTAVVGAALEALRIRRTVRFRNKHSPISAEKKGSDIDRSERSQFWGRTGSSANIAFLIQGESVTPEKAVWENDSIEEHWQRFISWGSENNYEIISVDLSKSKKNASPWEIHHVVIPQFQQMYLNEKMPYLTGKRLASVPEKFGFTPRKIPFTDLPHPFD